MSTSQVLVRGDCVETMRTLPDASIDAIVCDPPYGLEFMGKEWDNLSHTSASGMRKGDAARILDVEAVGGFQDGAGGNPYSRSRIRIGREADTRAQIAWHREWATEALRVLKPGGYLLAFGGTRTYHRMTVAIEDAGLEIRDCLSWQYGSGFPKSLNLPGGLGTALKPAWEPIVVARKPLEGTVAGNVLKHGTGALNIDGCRIESGGEHMVKGTVTKRTTVTGDERTASAAGMYASGASFVPTNHPGGRWPANVLLSCSPDCDGDTHAPGCPCAALDAQSGATKSTGGRAVDQYRDRNPIYGGGRGLEEARDPGYGDTGGASRFFNRLPLEEEDLVPFIYTAKASKKEKNAGMPEGTTCTHPTVKPIAVMRHLVRLCCRKGGTVLDPFMGSGTTGVAAVHEGMHFIGMELSEEYVETAKARITHAGGNPEVIP
jgi:site-specific DNA-methyltransferase (adenine-specific)